MKPSRLEILAVSLVCLAFAAMLVALMFGPALETALRSSR
jgi:hypothetical protein